MNDWYDNISGFLLLRKLLKNCSEIHSFVLNLGKKNFVLTSSYFSTSATGLKNIHCSNEKY